MKIIDTSKSLPSSLKPTDRDWVYNGLDCCITAEVLEVLEPQLDSITNRTYRFSRDLQAPVLEMRLRGILIDQARKAAVIDQYYDKLDQLERGLERIVIEGLGFTGFNWRSTQHKQKLFYDILKIPIIRKGGRPTTDRNALEKMEAYLIAKPIVRHLMAMEDLKKKIQMLKTEIDPDGRMRTSYNIAGTVTGRLSSSFSEFGTGTNLQNIEEILRSIFIADPGQKLAYLDAAQGESRAVGAIEWNLFKDPRYLDACESGDLHTSVARICWPAIGWTGELEADRGLAEQPYYRHYSRRFMCKKIGHGTNYAGKPRTLSQQAKVDIGVIEDFQPRYFQAFPAHLGWHEWVKHQLFTIGNLTTLTGRRRWFFGRRDNDETLRAAIAYDPQGSLADILDTGMLNVWRQRNCTLLMQIHDAVLVQYPEELEDEVIPLIKEQLCHRIELKHGREFVIPYDCKTGWNWGNWSKENPDGLKAYSPGDKRKRTPPVKLLDRRFR